MIPKLTKSNFSGKFSVLGKSPEIPPKFNSFMRLFFNPKMLHNNVLYNSIKAACSSKPGSSVTAQNPSTNQIAGFFDHQYLWKQSNDILDFLHGGNHQGKVTSGATTFFGV